VAITHPQGEYLKGWLISVSAPGKAWEEGKVQEPETPHRDPAGIQSSTAKGGL
jgi:hypothetical protein